MNPSIPKTESQVRNDAGEPNPYLPGASYLPPTDPRINASQVRKQQANLYLSRFNQELPEERLRKSKGKSIKLDRSTLKVSSKEDSVVVREERPLLNSSAGGTVVKGFQDQGFQNKQFKKFNITAILKPRDLIKESNYFDESPMNDSNIIPAGQRSQADFRIGDFDSFETFQIKTYLFDRNINKNQSA